MAKCDVFLKNSLILKQISYFLLQNHHFLSQFPIILRFFAKNNRFFIKNMYNLVSKVSIKHILSIFALDFVKICKMYLRTENCRILRFLNKITILQTYCVIVIFCRKINLLLGYSYHFLPKRIW